MIPGDSDAGTSYSHLVRWHVIPDMETLVDDVSVRIYNTARHAIELRGVFRIVLAGGSTPQAVYRELADCDADWQHWQVYYGDERCLPADHPERNSVLAARNWLERVDIPARNVHVIPAELGAPAAAHAYAKVIESARPFDMVLLGLGEDGHTASLFPGLSYAEGEAVHAVFDAPKPPAERVSLGVTALNDARTVLVMVTGASKQAAVRRWRNCEELPVAHIHGSSGVDVYLDPSAAGESAPPL
jgi:6-phosphogluconolactonase